MFLDSPLASPKTVLDTGRPLFLNQFFNFIYSLTFHVLEAFLKRASAVKLWLSEFVKVINESIGFEDIVLISMELFK